MVSKRYATLHPLDQTLGAQFQYGNMQVSRRPLDGRHEHVRGLISHFESYRGTGILPRDTQLVGDFLEHVLVKASGSTSETAGRYLGIVLRNGSYQYVRLEGESIGIDKRRLIPPDEIEIITDTCLFCAANATAVLRTGEEVSIVAPKTKINAPVETLRVSEHMCLYEMEAVLRLSDLIKAISAGNHAYKRAYLAMPTVEYYLYLMDGYNSGFIGRDTMRQWITTVNSHAERIANALGRRIGLPIRECQPLNHVRDYIEACVDQGLSSDFEKVELHLSQASSLWRDVLTIAKPKTWRDLNYTNYAVAVLEAAMVRCNPNRLTIDIENPSEQRILRNASKIARKLAQRGNQEQFRVIGIYPHEKIFIPDFREQQQSYPRLYYLDQDSLAGDCYYREIVEVNQRKYGEHISEV